MAENELTLVYGGGKVGLMGEIADEILRLGGKAIGVIPEVLMQKEVGHQGLTELHVVKNMHERKAMMAELSDGFVAMPGGVGTLEELFEIFTWAQLGIHTKPVSIFNAHHYYDGLISFLEHVVAQGFLREDQAKILIHDPDATSLIARLRSFTPIAQPQALQASKAKQLI